MLRIIRPDDDGLGTFAVSVDDRKIGTLNAGDQLVVYVPAGPHTISAKYAWIRSAPVTIDVSDGAKLKMTAKRRFGFGPFDMRYFTQRRNAIDLTVESAS
jgi:hypothetical protein